MIDINQKKIQKLLLMMMESIKESSKSAIEIRTSPSKISDDVIIHYRYKEDENSDFDDWIELTD